VLRGSHIRFPLEFIVRNTTIYSPHPWLVPDETLIVNIFLDLPAQVICMDLGRSAA